MIVGELISLLGTAQASDKVFLCVWDRSDEPGLVAKDVELNLLDGCVSLHGEGEPEELYDEDEED